MGDIELTINCNNTINDNNVSTLDLTNNTINNSNNNDETRCMASKNLKSLGIQCPLKRKNNSIFCGRHRNNKIDDTFDKYCVFNNELLNSGDTLLNKKEKLDTKSNSDIKGNLDTKKRERPDTKIISLKDFQDNSELNKCNKKSIRESFHHYNLDYYTENKERNVDIMLIKLKKFFKRILYYSIPENLKAIILIQKKIKKNKDKINNYYRGPAWNNIDKCNNDTDFFNFDKLEDIPPRYRITYMDNDNFIYGFHIYSLKELLSRGEKNPYTLKVFPEDLNYKVNKYVSILEKWEKLNKINSTFYNYKNHKKTKKSNNIYTENKNVANMDLASNIIEKTKIEINKLPIKQLTQIQCSQTFSKMTELGYQVNCNWLYGKTIRQLTKFVEYLHYVYDGYNFHHSELTEEQLLNGPLLYLINDISTQNIGTLNRFKFLQKVLKVLNYMLDTLGIQDCKNTISIMIIQALVILEPHAVRSNNPWLV